MSDKIFQPNLPLCVPSTSDSSYPQSFNNYPSVPQSYAMYEYTTCSLNSLLGCSEQLDASPWTPDPRAVADIERGLKLGDKMEAIEITSKDLSPVSCCSNLDLSYNKPETQWHCNNYLVCNSLNPDLVEKTCAQSCMFGSVREGSDDTFYCQNLDSFACSNVEVSNGDSDIIVEESDSDEDICIVCNSWGNQMCIVTETSPITVTTQQPVITRLIKIVGTLNSESKHLCSHCLGIINTIDNLEAKLETEKQHLFDKYKQHNATTVQELPEMNSSFHCKQCKKAFTLKDLCNIHTKQHRFRNRFLCELCGFRFNKIQNFRFHLRSHAMKKKALACHTCNKLFQNPNNLKNHINLCLGLLPYNCKRSGCDKKFATSTKLKHHIMLKHDQKFVAICSICNIGFVKPSDYKAHKTSHGTEKRFNCTKCEKMYKTVGNLNHHMKFHDSTLPFSCDICNKGFMRKDYLEAHVNNHNGVKNYSCQLCGKKFVAQKNLDAHLKYHEGSIKKKVCGTCNKSMSTGFEEHLRTHSNLLEFECNVCQLKFNTKGALAKHKKRKHV